MPSRICLLSRPCSTTASRPEDPQKYGRAFKHGSGEHPPAIEIYRDRRYFAFTGERLPGLPEAMQPVSVAQIQWLLEEAGPQFSGSDKVINFPGRKDTASPKSRSEKAFGKGGKLKRQGCTYEEMRDALLADDDKEIVAWVKEKGLANGERELHRVYDKTHGCTPSNKPRIFWSGEADDEACIAAEDALIAAGGVYERLGIIIGLGLGRGRTRRGEVIDYPALQERNEYGLRRDLARCVQFESENKKGEMKPCHPPMDLIRMLKHEGQTRLPVISGLLTAPTLRADGSILQEPGFDERTGLLFEPKGVEFLPVPDNPTKEEARAALDKLLHVLREFPFERKRGEKTASRSVALACILTGLVRQAFLFAPGYAFDAPVPRTGKGKVLNIAHVLAFGHRAVVENWTANEEENEKLLGSILLSGTGALAIDNIERPLGGGLISKVLTEEKISARILGKSQRIVTEPMMLVSFTGNNLKFKNDITARLLKCRLDAAMENPEERKFDWEPVAYALEHRAELVQAALIVLRAYIMSGERVECTPFGVCRLVADGARALDLVGRARSGVEE